MTYTVDRERHCDSLSLVARNASFYVMVQRLAKNDATAAKRQKWENAYHFKCQLMNGTKRQNGRPFKTINNGPAKQ